MNQEERYRRLVGLPDKHKRTVPDALRELSGELPREGGMLTCTVCNRLGLECSGRCSEWPAKLADRIEREAQEIYEAGMRAGAEHDFVELDWEEWGWPRPLPTENLREYVGRCMVVMPMDSDGNPWRVNDVAVVEGKNVTVSIVAFGSECVCIREFDDKSMEFDGPLSFLHPRQLERPPETLCADGEPPHLGEEVWLVGSPDKSYLVIGVYPNCIMLRENCESLPFDVLPQSVTHHKGVADMDGSPVKIGEDGLREIRLRWCYTPLKEHVVETTLIYDDGERVVALGAERVRKPYSGTPGRDGLPIQEGETVWNWIRGTVATVTSLHPYGVHVSHGETQEIWAYEHVVHTRPDMQEDIDEDAEMDPVEYCAVHDLDLGDDPDREKAAKAMVSDILYRQRCVDMRQYGVE